MYYFFLHILLCGTQIYSFLNLLFKIIQTKKIEIEQGKSKGIKIKRRGISLSAGIAALKEPIEESDDENDDNVETEGDGPLWQLFDQLYNSANATGMFRSSFRIEYLF